MGGLAREGVGGVGKGRVGGLVHGRGRQGRGGWGLLQGRVGKVGGGRVGGEGGACYKAPQCKGWVAG